MGRPADPSVLESIRRAAEGPRPRARLDAIEVTQAVQDLNGSVPLIEAKRTFVRAYLGVSSGAMAVRGELRVRHGPGPWMTLPSAGNADLDASRNGSTLAELRSRRDNLGYSLNFLLPSGLAGAGTLQVRLSEVRDAATGQRVQVTDPVHTATATFTATPPLRVRVINLRYSTGSPPVTYAATASDLDHLRSWLRRAYPVGEVRFSSITTDATATWPFEAPAANTQVAAIRALDMASGGDQGTHYYGIVADGGDFMRGSAAGIPGTPDPSVVASGPTGPGRFAWDTDGSYGDWYGGHELAHTFGRRHPGFCGGQGNNDPAYPFTAGQLADNDGAFVGFDVGDLMLGLPVAALPGTAWHDVMTYCDFQWLSSYTYEAIRDRLVAEAALFPVSGAVAAAPAMVGGAVNNTLVHVGAVVNLTARSGSIQQVTPLPGPLAPSPTPSETRLAIRTHLSSGTTQDHPVAFKPDLCRDPGDDDIGLVDAVLAVDSGTTAIELLIDGTAVARFEVGAAPSLAENLQVRPPEPDAAAGEAAGITVAQSTLSWDDPSAGDDGQSYVVQASTDHGATWTTLAVGARRPKLQLDAADFADAEQVRFRVLTSNGLSYTEATTDDLAVGEL
jgi:hypothetical protein